MAGKNLVIYSHIVIIYFFLLIINLFLIFLFILFFIIYNINLRMHTHSHASFTREYLGPISKLKSLVMEGVDGVEVYTHSYLGIYTTSELKGMGRCSYSQ